MRLAILDANSLAQNILTRGQEAIIDASGTIAATSVAQTIAAASSTRSGFFLMNLGTHNMGLNDLGAATLGAGSIILAPGASISAPANYPVSTGALSLAGTIGDGYTLRIW